MKKKIIRNLSCAFLAISLVFIEACSKKDINLDINNNKQQQIEEVKNESISEGNDKDLSIAKPVQIDVMNNVQLENVHLKEVIDDKEEKLKNGVYGCISKAEGSYYVFINGVDYWYSNITFNVKDKILTIKYDTKYERGLRIKHLFLIAPKNAGVFNDVELINNGNKETFKILFNN
ncbi:hypothetical protein [Clostridium sp.]|jgi:hypothetical protein|uniref:hypothetical protein n=1 Tax=Clostridium sp. TaxID=1506 RepID=UPI003EF07DA6